MWSKLASTIFFSNVSTDEKCSCENIWLQRASLSHCCKIWLNHCSLSSHCNLWGCFETIPSRIIFDKLQCLEFWYISQTPTRLLEKLWYWLDLFQVPESMLKNANKRWLWQFWERRWLKSQEVVQKMLLAWLSWLTADGQQSKAGCLYSDCNQRNQENLISVKDKGIKAKMNHRR